MCLAENLDKDGPSTLISVTQPRVMVSRLVQQSALITFRMSVSSPLVLVGRLKTEQKLTQYIATFGQSWVEQCLYHTFQLTFQLSHTEWKCLLKFVIQWYPACLLGFNWTTKDVCCTASQISPRLPVPLCPWKTIGWSCAIISSKWPNNTYT